MLEFFSLSGPSPVIVLFSLGACFLLPALITPLVMAMQEGMYLTSRKPFYEKLALQTAQAGLIRALPAYTLLITSFILTLPEELSLWTDANIALPALFIPLVSLAGFVIYLASWKMTKKHPKAHLTLGVIISVVPAMVTFTLLFLWLTVVMQPALAVLLCGSALPGAACLTAASVSTLITDLSGTTAGWASFLFLFFLGVASVFAFSLSWLMTQRSRADYGRDYYNFAVRTTARNAFLSMLVAMGTSAVFVCLVEELPVHVLSEGMGIGEYALAYGLPLCCAAAWAFIWRSAAPLRHKVTTFSASVLLYASVYAHFYFLFTILPVL